MLAGWPLASGTKHAMWGAFPGDSAAVVTPVTRKRRDAEPVAKSAGAANSCTSLVTMRDNTLSSSLHCSDGHLSRMYCFSCTEKATSPEGRAYSFRFFSLGACALWKTCT